MQEIRDVKDAEHYIFGAKEVSDLEQDDIDNAMKKFAYMLMALDLGEVPHETVTMCHTIITRGIVAFAENEITKAFEPTPGETTEQKQQRQQAEAGQKEIQNIEAKVQDLEAQLEHIKKENQNLKEESQTMKEESQTMKSMLYEKEKERRELRKQQERQEQERKRSRHTQGPVSM